MTEFNYKYNFQVSVLPPKRKFSLKSLFKKQRNKKYYYFTKNFVSSLIIKDDDHIVVKPFIYSQRIGHSTIDPDAKVINLYFEPLEIEKKIEEEFVKNMTDAEWKILRTVN